MRMVEVFMVIVLWLICGVKCCLILVWEVGGWVLWRLIWCGLWWCGCSFLVLLIGGKFLGWYNYDCL